MTESLYPKHASAPVETLVVLPPARSPFLLAIEAILTQKLEHERRAWATARFYP